MASLPQQVDLLVIGGGINGVGVAWEAALRGLSVLLVESHDLASGTSSGSSRLVHGGLRYLESYDFKLVRESLVERATLKTIAPHLVHPISFVLPYQTGMRSPMILRLGLSLYDLFSMGSGLSRSARVTLGEDAYGLPLAESIKEGFTYSDCRTDDARLVVTVAQAAREAGAQIALHTRCIRASRAESRWEVELEHAEEVSVVHAAAIVNAAGPWVNEVLDHVFSIQSEGHVRAVQGSHLVCRQLYDGDHAYVFQHTDDRIVFMVPYDDQHTMIGTTDCAYDGDLRDVRMTDEERGYLLEVVNRYMKQPVAVSDIVWSYSAVRPLYDSHEAKESAVTREYRIECDVVDKQLPLLTVFGGKLTTFRHLAEKIGDRLSEYFPGMTTSVSAKTQLPGGDIGSDKEFFCAAQCQRYPELPSGLVRRYALSYGRNSDCLLKGVESLSDLGQHFGADLYAKEIDYLKEHEWARDVEDVIWRRTKCGLYLNDTAMQSLEDYLGL